VTAVCLNAVYSILLYTAGNGPSTFLKIDRVEFAMPMFCEKCGNQLSDTSAFCNACGAPVVRHTAPTAAPYQDVPQQPASTPPPQPYAPSQSYAQAAPRAKAGSGLKILLIVLAVLALGAITVLGGIIFVGHKVVSKIEDKAAENGLSLSKSGDSGKTFQGDACRFLTPTEVSKALGVTITGTRSNPASCDYLAHGTAANMTSKHLSAIMKKNGADQATQDKLEKFAQGVFNTQEKNAQEADPTSNGDTAVLTIAFDEQSAQAQMKLDSKVLGALGPASGSSNLQGVGDEAFVAANGMMLVRKGDTLVRFTYISCPCSTEEVTPLAKKLAAAL
jgi:zinc-ribbon domain